DAILRIPAQRLTAFAPALPDLVISSPALAGPQSLTFDGAGNLWVLNFDGAGPSVSNVVRFDDPRALTGDQVLTPSLTISPGAGADDIGRFRQGTAIALDGAGSLWLASLANVLRFDRPASLTGAITAAPDAVIRTGEAYASLALDGAGALWVTAARDGRYYL